MRIIDIGFTGGLQRLQKLHIWSALEEIFPTSSSQQSYLASSNKGVENHLVVKEVVTALESAFTREQLTQIPISAIRIPILYKNTWKMKIFIFKSCLKHRSMSYHNTNEEVQTQGSAIFWELKDISLQFILSASLKATSWIQSVPSEDFFRRYSLAPA